MARRKDLTALAALGTLGYMLSKKGDKKDEKSTSDAAERRIAADRVASEAPQSMENDAGMDPEEAANMRTERMLTNPNAKEFGEAGTSMTVSPPSRLTAPKPAARKPVVKSRPMSAAAEAAMQEANISPTTRAEYDRGISNVPRRNSYYKRGGAVKGYASGGSVSSASKRADGIATKGKTRGKMY
jgi:hypothetical protein